MYAETVVYLTHFRKGKVLELLPEPHGLRVAGFNLFKPETGLVIQFGVLLRLLMKAHIQLYKLPNSTFIHRLFAPFFVGNYHFAKLGAPVSKVVYGDGIVAKGIVYAIKRAANGGAGKMAYMERLCYIYGGKLHAYVLTRALMGAAVAFPGGEDFA